MWEDLAQAAQTFLNGPTETFITLEELYEHIISLRKFDMNHMPGSYEQLKEIHNYYTATWHNQSVMDRHGNYVSWKPFANDQDRINWHRAERFFDSVKLDIESHVTELYQDTYGCAGHEMHKNVPIPELETLVVWLNNNEELRERFGADNVRKFVDWSIQYGSTKITIKRYKAWFDRHYRVEGARGMLQDFEISD